MIEPVGTSRRVVLYGNPALRTKARPIRAITADIRRLFADLKASMLAADGLGLAANQIAETVQCFAVNPPGADVDAAPYCLCNPQLIGAEGRIEREEGCLSLPGLYDILARPEHVRVRGIDENGREVTVEASGLLARVLLHELDHLNGVLFIDHLSPTRQLMVNSRLQQLAAREQDCA